MENRWRNFTAGTTMESITFQAINSSIFPRLRISLFLFILDENTGILFSLKGLKSYDISKE